MAEDQELKRRRLAGRYIGAARVFADSMRDCEQEYQEYVSSGLTFVDSDFVGQDELKHLTPTMMLEAGAAVHAMLDAAIASGDWAKVLKVLK
jgi:hypothetical protein